MPSSLSGHIENVKGKIVVRFPSAKTTVLEFEALFTLRFEFPGNSKLKCQLVVGSSVTELVVIQSSDQGSNSVPALSVTSAIDSTLTQNIEEQINAIPTVGKQILKAMSLRKMVFHLSDRKIKSSELNIVVSELDIVRGKLSVQGCALKISYSVEGLAITCSGHLLFLGKCSTLAQFNLPTARQEGHICFENYDGLKLDEVLQKFGWLTDEVRANQILNKVLAVVVKKVSICFDVKDDKLQIKAMRISIFKEQLDIGLLVFKNVELDVCTRLVKGQYITAFSLGAFISEALYAQLKYDPERKVLSGLVKVTFSKFVSAVDVLQLFQASSISYEKMKSVLKDDFMDVFNSNLKITSQPGLTALLTVSIKLPSKQSTHYSLQHLKLEIQDALKICCKNSYVLTAFRFEYTNKSSQQSPSSSHLSLEVHKLNSNEDMILDFNLTGTADNCFFTAEVKAGPRGGFLKLRSAIDLAQASIPELPKFDVGLPKIFDIELLSGSITFQLKPSFKPSAFDINILIEHWQLLDDPKLAVHKIMLKTAWKSGENPQLSFTDCSLNFLGHELSLSGRLTSEEVYIQCQSAKRFSESYTKFESVLNDYTPKSQPRPVIPTDIELPDMTVELKKLIIHLKKTSQIFRVNTALISNSPWKARFGLQSLTVRDIGGALEWTKSQSKTEYLAFLYGRLEIFGMQVDMNMLLGKGIDSIVTANVRNPQCLGYGQVADNLLNSEQIVPYHQHNPSNSGLSELVPPAMQNISLVAAATALNLSKKQFFLSSEVQEWGTGSLLLGYLVDKKEMDYVVSISLEKSTTFGRFSEALAFVDELILLRSVDILVSSCDLQDMSVIKKSFSGSFCQSLVQPQQIQNPFYESKLVKDPELAKYGIRAGTTIYAEIDIANSKGISKLLELGDRESSQRDISIMTYIGKAKTETNVEICAWIPRISLFRVLEFSKIHLLYKVRKESEFELRGIIALHLNLTDSKPSLKFEGQLLVCSDYAKFCTESCKDMVSRPCGIDVCISNLKLAFTMHYRGESPDIAVSGGLKIGYIHLTCEFLLKGITFRVFKIKLVRELRLSALLKCYLTDWPIMLDIVIKEGEFYYCNQTDHPVYKYGYHLKALITLLNSDFRVEAHMPDRENIKLSGRSIQKIDFLFAKITGEHNHTHEGPAITYRGSEKSLALTLGVQILNTHCFEGEIKYIMGNEPKLEGTIKCPLKFLWINEPSMKVEWTESGGFKIVEFNLFGDVGFSLLSVIGKIAKTVVAILSGGLSYDWQLRLRTDKNPDPRKHLVHIVLYGEISITVLGFISCKIFPLPEMHILLPKVEDFSVSKLPKYILKALWDSIGYTIRSLLEYLNPFKLLWKGAELIWDSVKGTVKAVVNVAKKIGRAVVETGKAIVRVGKKIWRGICSIFGGSAFVVDMDNGMVLGYIRGGRAGKDLCNFEYTVEQFGPVVTANAIGTMAHQIHKHLESCVTAREYETEDNDKPRDEIDSKNSELEEGLKELKEKAEQLSQSLTIVAGNVLAVNDISISAVIDDRSTSISVEWFVYNPEEETPYNKDKGDIEYRIKFIALVFDPKKNVINILSLYDNVFTDASRDDTKLVNSDEESSHTSQITQDTSQERQHTETNEQEVADIEANVAAEGAQDIEQVGSEEQVLKQEQGEGAFQKVSSEPNLAHDEKENTEDEELGAAETSNKQEKETEPPKRIKFDIKPTSLDPDTLKYVMCLNVCIQPTVTLEVKMLPPDKIASDLEKYKVDTNKLEDGDKSWMVDMKDEIETNGRINDVTLEGRKACKQHILHQVSQIPLQFTVTCTHRKDGITVTGDIIVPIPEAHSYFIQLIDESDTTIIIKQSRLFSPNLHFQLEASLSDFPVASVGPYHVSIIALNADLEACSTLTNSELKITRYHPPEKLSVSIPNFDLSDSDIISLEWKHLGLMERKSEEGDATKVEEPTTTDSQKDGQTAAELEQDPNVVRTQECSSADNVPAATGQLSNENEENEKSTELDTHVQEPAQMCYTLTITGIHVKKPKKQDHTITEDLETSDEAFKLNLEVDENSLTKYDFSLKHLLDKHCPQLQDGLIFQCQVFSNGLSKLHSIPRLFPDFILLIPPTKLRVTTPEKEAGLCIDWEYSLHAVGYRLELVAQQDKSVVIKKILKCDLKDGNEGKAILFKKELNDILSQEQVRRRSITSSFTSSNSGYKLQLYSLGFGSDLIRCLEPTIANEVLHVIESELRYLSESNMIQIHFKPHTMKREYVVELYRFATDNTSKACYLINSAECHQKVHNGTVIVEIPLRHCQYLLQSGDLVVAWVHSTGPDVTYMGSPKEEILVLDSPLFKDTSLAFNLDGTVRGMKLAWQEIPGSCGYQCGVFLTGKKEHVLVMEMHETEVTIHFLLEQLKCDGSCQFQVYVTALGKHSALIVGALSLDTHLFQCITNPSVKTPIVFTSAILYPLWTKHLLSLAACNYYSLTSNPRHFLLPSGEQFPSIRIPKKMRDKFWHLAMEDQLFGNNGNIT